MKKTIAVFATLALALSLSACGKNDANANAALANDVVLNDDGAVDANVSDNLSADDAALGNGADDAALGNDAAGNAL